mmetsp:Transcript_163724/g.520323  ORF Transcript_163724/g.520323 Transcript_163724/m.520323 type:complete len:632 (-) Transcript_163724:745-2640(-)
MMQVGVPLGHGPWAPTAPLEVSRQLRLCGVAATPCFRRPPPRHLSALAGCAASASFALFVRCTGHSTSSAAARRRPRRPAVARWLRCIRRQALEGESGPLVVAERYSSFSWWQHLLDIPHSRILERIAYNLSFNVVLAIVVCVYHQCTDNLAVMPATPLILSSAALGLLLVFRTTAAHERWQLGLNCTYDLRHNLQQILRVMRPWYAPRQFTRLQQQVRTFPQLIDSHLTASPGEGILYGVGPRDLITQISEELCVYCSKRKSDLAVMYCMDRTLGHINQILKNVCTMEQLASEAVPRDYSRHTSRFLTVWMSILPFVLLDYGGFMPLVVGIVSWALLSIEEIGHTLEDPFNSPTQPVPVRQILEYGGGEHTLASGGMPATSPLAEPLWERDAVEAEDTEDLEDAEESEEMKAAVAVKVDVLAMRRLALKSHHGRHVRADANGDMKASSEDVGEAEKFDLVINAEDTTISLRSCHGKYVSVDKLGEVRANQPAIGSRPGDSEKFQLVCHDDGTISLGSHTGFVAAEAKCGLRANRALVGDWEKFQPVDQGTKWGVEGDAGHSAIHAESHGELDVANLSRAIEDGHSSHLVPPAKRLRRSRGLMAGVASAVLHVSALLQASAPNNSAPASPS